MLKEKDKVNSQTSFISEPWFTMYLRDRAPLPVNYNPILLMRHDPKPEYNDQLVRTSNIIVSSLRFMRSLKAEVLVPEIFHMDARKTDTDSFRAKIMKFPTFMATYAAYFWKAYPLDMFQYQGLFGATRIPQRDKDIIYRNENSRHVLVTKDGNLYSVEVLDANGNIRDPEFIYSQMKYLNSINSTPSPNPIGALTSQNRRIWAAARTHLTGLSTKNADNMTIIDSALFCINLDNTTFDEANQGPTVRNFLFDECKNRWYDKSFSVIVDKSGTAGVNFEHSWGDGVAVLRYFNELYKDTLNKPFVHPNTNSSVPGVEPTVKLLEFDVDERVENDVKTAIKAHEDVVNSIDLNFLHYTDINKVECKKFKVSPDSMMQLSFQMAYYKQNKKFVSCYESCSTSAFRHGRTETMRPLTAETKEFVLSISKKDRPSDKQMRALLEKCSTRHNQLTKEAAMGQGFDRHLFAMKTAAERVRILEHFDVFNDPSYAKLNHNIISTSTLSSPALLAGGFGPVVKDGYGIGYNIQETILGVIVSNYKNETNGKDLLECLRQSYDELSKVIRA
jgi:carnitine O-palmitoyltransferase 2